MFRFTEGFIEKEPQRENLTFFNIFLKRNTIIFGRLGCWAPSVSYPKAR